MTTTMPDLYRLVQAERKRRNRRKALRQAVEGLLTVATGAPGGGWELMLAVGIAYGVWLPKLPTIGYWWAVLLVFLLRGTFSRHMPTKDKDDTDGEPRTWAAPEAPGADVTTLRDDDGYLWQRQANGWSSNGTTLHWPALLAEFGQLTEATGEVPSDG